MPNKFITHDNIMRLFFDGILSARCPVNGARTIETNAFIDRMTDVRTCVCDWASPIRSSRITGSIGTMKLKRNVSNSILLAEYCTQNNDYYTPENIAADMTVRTKIVDDRQPYPNG